MRKCWLQANIPAGALGLVSGLYLPKWQQQVGIHGTFLPILVCVILTCLLPWGARSGTDDDLEFYIRKCGDILGVTSKLPKEKQDAKHILEYIFFQVVEFKKRNQVF